MRRMLDPKTIALIGATETPDTVGRTIMENLMASEGRDLFPVNPNHKTIFDVPCFPSIGAVGVPIDLAVVATPAAGVPEILLECAKAGVYGAIVVSAGFGETGKEGLALEKRIKKILRDYPMRVVGPNCLGIIRPSVGLNASFLTVSPEPGDIALISQSGALGTGMLDWAVSAHVGFSLFASVGSMVDVDFADLIDFLGEDSHTRAILVYMETIGSARRFMSAARSFARNKPIIVLKPGRYSESARAALSHTGALAGDDEVYEAAFRRVGVLRVHEVADLFHAAEVLDSRRLPVGPGVAIVTNAGGLGVMATDSVIEHGGRLAQLSDKTMAALDEALPPYWSHANPVDLLGDAGSDRFVAAMKACLADQGVNGIVLLYTPQGNARPDDMAAKVAALVKGSAKPVITALMGGETVAAGRAIFQEAAVPCYNTPEEAVRTYMSMYEYARNLELLYETPAELAIDVAPPKHNLQAMLRRIVAGGRTVLTEEESKRFITTYGFPVVPQVTAETVDEALKAAKKVGYPVVLKIMSHNITHKSASGGVEVGVCSPADLEAAWARIMKRVAKSSPKAVIEGVSVQKMIREVDFELILGMKKDAQFGSVIVFGAGGVGAEGLADFSVSLPPLNQTLARRMMEDTRIFRTIASPRRGVVAPKVEELEELLTVLSNIVVDFPEIAEIDINPLVIADGKACAVDARIVIDKSVLDNKPKRPHMVITPYPTRYVTPWRLSDGTEVLLRPIRPEDEPMIADFLRTVSELTLRQRYFVSHLDISHELLTRFVNIDYDREIAIVGELGQGKKKRIIGVGRLMGEADRGRGEFAVIVHDEFQRRGLGFKLTDTIIGIAQEKGLREISGYIDSNNHRMLQVVSELGFIDEGSEDCVTTVRLPLE
ncbi:MAG: bifunctional acetate--CoA ligase family protein/GNAT family N-acetyltransferase [Coriobacteriia bacterium]|nr:bifunctional acetate--CoA ligase family protein/GNAT family N-acetyltransferase [Coriobacteriia bacterium]